MTNIAGALAAILVVIGGVYVYNNFQIKKVETSQKASFVDELVNKDLAATATTTAKAGASNQNPLDTRLDTLAKGTAATRTTPAPTQKNARVAKNGDAVFVNYVGKLEDGTVFDSNIDPQKPFGFLLGAGMVIKGWDEGVLGMKVGEMKDLTIPPEKAYGAQGVKDGKGKSVIPPNATLLFKVQVVAIQDYTPQQKAR
ncbi:MAG: hypothetical protein RL094_543 [Candidatus Parcubacteria bacterium]